MKSTVAIILLLFIVHSLGYIYNSFLKIEKFDVDDSDKKIEKALQTALEKFSFLDSKKESMNHRN
tara:strand:+ start:56 stop:250 length:195 start_codon:yes stop_codon:yes gene_type:complete